jgi:hypothetical protein
MKLLEENRLRAQPLNCLASPDSRCTTVQHIAMDRGPSFESETNLRMCSITSQKTF